MRTLTGRVVIALLTFVLGIAATTAWYLKRSSANQDARLIIPHASWEPIFFRSINSVAVLSGQTDLRKTRLPEGDVEVRIWWGFGLSPLEGVTLRHIAGRWSAIHVEADNYYEPKKADRRDLRAPSSGWEVAWQRLVNAGILTLPDASELKCNVDGLDGGAFVVEINKAEGYRTYMYDVPSAAKCNEARQMMEIGDIIFEEFNLGSSRN